MQCIVLHTHICFCNCTCKWIVLYWPWTLAYDYRIIKSIHEDGHLGKSIFVTHCSELEIGIVRVTIAITAGKRACGKTSLST